ncbi:hypothetical protein ABZ892_09155 [Streptomyces sp. NPDC046924]|uniref:hypothetical protein n=1 Tax=Streptomyces sp. NPDC046924 TaxID=3155136 RepID=UPI0033C4214A
MNEFAALKQRIAGSQHHPGLPFDFMLIEPRARVAAMPRPGHHLRSLRFTFGFAPTCFTACRETGDPALQHALADEATLCGIPRRRVTVYRCLFVAKRSGRCSDCRVRAVDAMSRS